MSAGFLLPRHRRASGVLAAVFTGLLFQIAFGGCATVKRVPIEGDLVKEEESLIKRVPVEEDLVKEEESLTESIKNESNPLILAEAYLSRARLRLRADNPRIDYVAPWKI
jgi:hypothetical protein